MAKQISIWRWALTSEFEPLFARLITATDEEFAAIGAEIEADAAPQHSMDDMAALTEAKMRAMDLPQDILDTMLRGLKTMMDEAPDQTDTPEAATCLSLASSHLFHHEPYVSLAQEEIERQVAKQLGIFQHAASAVMNDNGQSLTDFLALPDEGPGLEHALDILIENELAAVVWVWPLCEQVYYLSQWQEDKDLPIDLEFGRAPRATFEQARAQITPPHEM